MPLLQDKDKEAVETRFQEELVNPVRLVNFTQALECQFCEETRQLVEEVAALSDRIELEVYNFAIDKEKVGEYGVDKIPAIAIIGEKDYGVRYYGIPSGYEFNSLIEDIIDVSRREVELLPATREALAGITEPLHFQVFVTPTWPYCPQSVRLAHKLAIEGDHVRADAVEAMEFPQLAIKYNVRGVPRIVINETIQIEGAVPEPMLMAQLQEAFKPDEDESWTSSLLTIVASLGYRDGGDCHTGAIAHHTDTRATRVYGPRPTQFDLYSPPRVQSAEKTKRSLRWNLVAWRELRKSW